jgi:hypothetical protein
MVNPITDIGSVQPVIPGGVYSTYTHAWTDNTLPTRYFPLEFLPLEIIYEIVSHLAPSSARSLSNTCKLFYNLLSPQPVYHRERFKFLCRLDRDQLLSKPVCSGCMTTHEKTNFRVTELREQPEFRECLKTQGLLWVCPYKALSFLEVKRFATNLDESKISCPHSCCAWGGAPSWYCDEGGHCTIESTYPINSWEGKPSPQSEVQETLNGYDIPICPHLRLSDPAILKTYNSNCIYDDETYNGCLGVNCPNCSGPGSVCQHCETIFEFRVRRNFERPSRTVHLRLIVTRELGYLRSVTNMT